MKLSKYVKIGLIVLCISACHSEKNVEYIKDNKNAISLFHKEVKQFKGVKLSGIGLVDSLLMIVNDTGKFTLSFYSLNNLNKIADFGHRLDGQFILTQPKYHNQFESINGKTYFYIMDVRQHMMLMYDLKEVLNNEKAAPYKKIILPPSIASSYVSLFITPDSNLIGNQFGDGQRRGRFFSYNLRLGKTKWTTFFPKVNMEIPNSEISTYYYSQCTFHKKSHTLFSAMYLFKRVDIIDTRNMKSNAKVFKKYKDSLPEFIPGTKLAGSNLFRFYSFVFGGDKFVYAYCINNYPNNYLQDKGNMELHIFTWDGQLKKIFKLDRLHLGRFIVDERKNILYAINYETDSTKSSVISYELNSQTDE